MTQTLTRSQCVEVRWNQKGISFEYLGKEDAFVIGQRLLFENKDYLVVECGFSRIHIGVIRWTVEIE